MRSNRAPGSRFGAVWRRATSWLRGGRDEAGPPFPYREAVEQLLRSFPGPAALEDADGVLLDVNHAMARRLGVADPKDARGRRQGGLKGPRPSDAGGALKTIPVSGDAGRARGTLVIGVDRTEQDAAEHRAQSARQESELLHAVLNCIPDQIYAKDADHRFVVANAAVARRITNSPQPERVLGKTDHDFFPLEDADRYRRDEATLMASGKNAVELEERAVYQGRAAWNQTSKVVLRAGSRVTLLVGINRDVTARREAETALASERALLESLMDNIPDCIYFKDGEGRFVRANRAQAAFLGVKDPALLVERRLSSFLTGRSALDVEAAEREMLRSGEAQVGQVEQLRRADGADVWFLSTKVPLRDAEGRVTGLVAISRDITERRQAEQDLEASLDAFLEFANQVAEGDLTQRARAGADTVGRIGAAVNRMLERIGRVLQEVKGTVTHVGSSADEILLASRYIADGADRQSGEVLSTSASVEELAASMNTVSRDATSWAGSSQEALAQVVVGDTAVQRTTEAMNSIFESVTGTAGQMRLLARRVSEISTIIEMIDELASQSTMLSLNAAIQSAHAGEAGRGFGVVADEIRRLAERSTRATREVADIIETIQSETSDALASTESGLSEVREGRDLAERASGALRRISESVADTSRLSLLISSASTEQAEITRQLAGTMENFASISQSSSASAHETTQTVQALVELARQLERGLGRFKVRESG